MSDLPRILLVDDEPHILSALSRQLRAHFGVTVACGSREGLATVESAGPFVVVVSDLQMPEMDGTHFLARVREISPDTVRILLTGHADVTAAIGAVNRGQIFRFLTKPCVPDDLIFNLRAAVEQHRLLTAERVLLEQTLNGCIKALSDILALVNPAAFGRSQRVQKLVAAAAARLELSDVWQLEIATTLSQIGCMVIPEDVVEKLYSGSPLTKADLDAAARLPLIAADLVSTIPRLDEVREIIRHSGSHADAPAAEPPLGARLLRAAFDLDALESKGLDREMSLATLRARTGRYDARVLDALASDKRPEIPCEIHELPLRQVEVGMVFEEDIRSATGLLMIARGQEATASLVERLRFYPRGLDVDRMVRTTAPNRARVAAAQTLTK